VPPFVPAAASAAQAPVALPSGPTVGFGSPVGPFSAPAVFTAPTAAAPVGTPSGAPAPRPRRPLEAFVLYGTPLPPGYVEPVAQSAASLACGNSNPSSARPPPPPPRRPVLPYSAASVATLLLVLRQTEPGFVRLDDLYGRWELVGATDVEQRDRVLRRAAQDKLVVVVEDNGTNVCLGPRAAAMFYNGTDVGGSVAAVAAEATVAVATPAVEPPREPSPPWLREPSQPWHKL
jgi:hypothetical protein